LFSTAVNVYVKR